MEDSLVRFGLPALFLVAFLAATIMPLGSEWLLGALLLQGADPVAAVAFATAGNFLGACTTWALGCWGSPWLLDRVLRIDRRDQERAKTLFDRYGPWALLLSWAPVVGDPLCLLAGFLKIPFPRFALPTFAGKLGRYAVIALALGSVS